MAFATNTAPRFTVDGVGVAELTELPRFVPAVADYLDHDGEKARDAGILDNETGKFAPFADPVPEVMDDLALFAAALNVEPENPFAWVEPIE